MAFVMQGASRNVRDWRVASLLIRRGLHGLIRFYFVIELLVGIVFWDRVP